MPITDHVRITLTEDSAGLTRAGFGTTLILSATAGWAERVRTYAGYADVLTDFPAESPEGRAARAIFSQEVQPEQVKIGRSALPPTLVYTVTAESAFASTDYEIEVKTDDPAFDDDTATVTTDGATTVAEINAALVTALNAITGNNYLAAFAALVIADDTFTAEADDEILTDATHGFQTGDGPVRVSNSGGALPTGLLEGVDYWIIRIDANTFYLASSLANAFAGTNVTFSTDGTGTQTISDTASDVVDFAFTAANAGDLFTAVAHGLHTGDKIRVSGGSLPTGVVAATDYWVIKSSDNTFQLAASLADAQAGTEIILSSDGSGTALIQDVTATSRPGDAFTVTADAAGDWFSLAVEAGSISRIRVSQSHSDPGVATDLAAILVEDGDWYHLQTLYNSDAYVKAAAGWIETAERIYTPALSESEAIFEAADGTQGTLDDLDAADYARTGGMWYHDPSVFADAAWAASVLVFDPGDIIFAYRQLSGVPASSMLTTTHQTNLKNRNATFVKSEAGKTFTWRGWSSAGAALDIIRDLDSVRDDARKECLGVFLANRKNPYTDGGGISAFKAALKAVGARAEAAGIAAPGSVSVVVPKAKDVSSANKVNRVLTGCKLFFTLANAIEEIEATITVTQ